MARQRANPHNADTPEHVLYRRWKLSETRALALRQQADTLATEAGAEQARADHYAKALDALGHPVTPRLLEGPKP
ncbi:MAG: hypothetical protein Q8R81_09620 [Novosphingobium sp.]|uniref:hypothetical protein n=1 Tax=Novosphingobium sp. TaxID=1874826 RepID=UPI002732B845|nr:hypothetical protein [Novosphingobium sp.]MDP3550643.1 hypothetical protein [Novosphingobium sp.]